MNILKAQWAICTNQVKFILRELVSLGKTFNTTKYLHLAVLTEEIPVSGSNLLWDWNAADWTALGFFSQSYDEHTFQSAYTSSCLYLLTQCSCWYYSISCAKVMFGW